ncbi:MAG: signal peptidase I [Hadesarchaea archaeon]|nr:MAG: signal peptidase I [Hadesarchaea archaeon]
MSRKVIIILIMLLAVYGLLSVFHPGGLMAYVFPSVCWGLLALATLWACGLRRIRSWFDKRVTIVAALVAIFYIIIYMDIGLFTGFGRSPLSFTPGALMVNLILVSSTLLGMEFSRAYIIKSFGGRRPFLTVGLVTLLYSFISISIVGLLSFSDPLALTRFLGTGLLPIVAVNLLASYLALIGGPIASLAYRAPLMALMWFSPILPNLSWGTEALLGVMAPVMSFLVINQFTPTVTLRRSGIPVEPKGFGRNRRSSLRGWMIASVLCVIVVWTSTGLLGIRPTTMISGSMQPTMDVGDIAIVLDVPADSVQPGDIIQFWRDEEMVVHRVVEISRSGNGRLFVTKGDANREPDAAPVYPSQVRGKVVLNIPKVGWAAIAVKGFFSGVWSIFSANPVLIVLAIMSGAFIFYVFRAHKNRSVKRWRRKGLGGQKFIVPLSSVLIVMAITGFAYSHWSDDIYMSGTVKTGHWRTIIDSYKVLSPYDDDLIEDQLSPNNRTLLISSDNVFSSWYVWVGLKIHNPGAQAVLVKEPIYAFHPNNAEDNFEIETYFYGPYRTGKEIPENVWQKARYWNLPADDNREPPIRADHCEHVFVWIKLHSVDNLGAVQISITVTNELAFYN